MRRRLRRTSSGSSTFNRKIFRNEGDDASHGQTRVTLRSDRNKKRKEVSVAIINSENESSDRFEDSSSNAFDSSNDSDERKHGLKSVRPVKTRGRRIMPEKYAEYAAYRGHLTNWIVLTKLERQQLAMQAIAQSADGMVNCLNEKCKKALKTMEDVINHLDKCLSLPEYFKYMGKADLFRALDKPSKAKILRVSMKALKVLPCLNMETLNCAHKYGHLYALSYHLERCGQEKDRLPWKCWKCGITATIAESREHLTLCQNPKIITKERSAHESELSSENEESDEDISADAKKIRLEKGEKYKKQKLPSIARGYLPEKDSRVKIADGIKRFKFKSANREANAPTPRELELYQQSIDEANEILRKSREKEPLCSVLVQLELYSANFSRVASCEFSLERRTRFSNYSEDLSAMLSKRSIPVVIPSDQSDEDKTVTSTHASSTQTRNTKNKAGKTKERLSLFVPKPLHCKVKKINSILSKKQVHEIGCIAYCGGPISTIKSCPRKLEDGRECVAVTVFPDEEYLVSKNRKDSNDYIQFWLYDYKPTSTVASLWFLLEVKHSTVLCTAWCPSLRGSVKQDSKLSDFVGILAVGGINAPISFYGIRSDICAQFVNNTDPLLLRCSEPHLALNCPECCNNSPIISISWSEIRGSSKFAAVSASGHVLIWDLDEGIASPKIISNIEWLSPPLNVAFCGSEQLAVSFREKLIRIYDLASLTLVIEESAQRTAGMQVGNQVCSREGLFSGVFSYQQDFTLSGIHLKCGTCYIVLGSLEGNFFVVPLANRHEVQIWDMCICPKTGTVISVGADGRLQISLNGRLVASGSEKDFGFSVCQVVMTVVKKYEEKQLKQTVFLINEPTSDIISQIDDGECEVGTDFPLPLTNLDLCAEKSYLEFCFEDIKHTKTPIPQFSLDLRTESLNRLAVSEPSGQLVISGGEAGLLIFIPCYLK
ncbi:unnamed protein product [Thelazia callipaeda]|uniref:MYND-type domain-containing protein n=1 Tax=Thelazia callipaeda TaxID=103827 RepID=A0A158RB15_THECL|nr:unnamed protein product [Thelazia callipaeda]